MIIGIDLGTTNSVAAVWKDGKAQLIPNSLGDYLTPSAVSVVDKGDILLGLPARDRSATHPDFTATAFKRLMGTETKLPLGRTQFSPEDLSALVLASLKKDAEAFLGEPVSEAVITVPAYFNDKQRKATQRAARMAGLDVQLLINEPTAAALAYGIHELDKEEPFLVFDLGGGTFDVSIVEIFDNIVEVRSSAGDPRLGGIDFNDALVRLAFGRLKDRLDIASPTPALNAIMQDAAERARRMLTDQPDAEFRFVWSGQEYRLPVTQADFDEAVAPLITRLRDPVLRSLRDIGLTAEQLREIVLVGGATRMPVVRRAVTRLFGRFPNHSLDPDQAVALGASVMAGLRSKDVALKEIRMTDVCPFTLGVDVMEVDQFGHHRAGIFSPIIERNRTIPTSKVKSFQTMQDNQRVVAFGIYQGEARDVASNIKLGEIKIKVPPGPAGYVQVNCRFSYDVSGLLEVDVSVPSTGASTQTVLGGEDLDRDDLAMRRDILGKLKVHPREEADNAAALARAERCYEALVGEARDHVGQIILAFEAVLDQQEPHATHEMRAQLNEALDAIEGERYL